MMHGQQNIKQEKVLFCIELIFHEIVIIAPILRFW
jgi:hypothetical protein